MADTPYPGWERRDVEIHVVGGGTRWTSALVRDGLAIASLGHHRYRESWQVVHLPTGTSLIAPIGAFLSLDRAVACCEAILNEFNSVLHWVDRKDPEYMDSISDRLSALLDRVDLKGMSWREFYSNLHWPDPDAERRVLNGYADEVGEPW